MPIDTAKQIWDASRDNPMQLLQNILDSGSGGKPEAVKAAITLRAAEYSREQARFTLYATIAAAVSAIFSVVSVVLQLYL